GRIGVAKPEYALSYPNDKRLVTPGLGYPLGEEPAVLDEQGDALRHVAIQQGPNAIYVAAVTEDKRLLLGVFSARTSILGITRVSQDVYPLPSLPEGIGVTAMQLDRTGRDRKSTRLNSSHVK